MIHPELSERGAKNQHGKKESAGGVGSSSITRQHKEQGGESEDNAKAQSG
jgi:hypothetical protein